jgi:hypothetical protein
LIINQAAYLQFRTVCAAEVDDLYVLLHDLDLLAGYSILCIHYNIKMNTCQVIEEPENALLRHMGQIML